MESGIMKRSMTGKNWLVYFCACIVFALCVGDARAEVNESESDGPAPIKLEDLHKSQPALQPVETQPAEQPEQPQPVKAWSIADENIDLKLLQTPVVPVTAPKGAPLRKNSKGQPLPVEGTAVTDRKGTIKLDAESGWMVMTFENQPGRPWVIPRRLLQCSLLEKVEEILEKNPNTRFDVIGETTVFSNNAYLIFRRVAVIDSPPPPKPAPDKTAPQPLVTPQNGQPETAKAPPAEPADQKDNAGKTSLTTTELIKAMMKDKPRTALRVDPASDRSVAENVESVAPAGKEPLNPGRKSLVIDRLVRLVEKGHWWEAHFESDNTLREPPMRVLPNSLLTRGVHLNRQLGQGELKLRVSGEITSYKGRRYLLIRKLLVERDLDQF